MIHPLLIVELAERRGGTIPGGGCIFSTARLERKYFPGF